MDSLRRTPKLAAQQKLDEQKSVLSAQHNEDLLRQQRRLEDVHEAYYRERLTKQAEKQYEGARIPSPRRALAV